MTSTYKTVSECQQWSATYDEAYAEYIAQHATTSTHDLKALRTALRVTLATLDSARATGAIVAVTEILSQRTAL